MVLGWAFCLFGSFFKHTNNLGIYKHSNLLTGPYIGKGTNWGVGWGIPLSSETHQTAGSLTTQEKDDVPAMGHSLASISVLSMGDSCILFKTSSCPRPVKTEQVCLK